MSTHTWYWEKTVEYAFVKEAKFEFAAPLSGAHERAAGDGIFGAECLLVLVEFKRNSDLRDSETKKFKNYIAAATELRGQDSHHFLVFPRLAAKISGLDRALRDVVKKETKREGLQLDALTYFGHEKSEALACLSKGAKAHTFDAYLTRLAWHKEPDRRSPKEPDFASVLGVTSDDEIVGTVTLAEYERSMTKYMNN